MAMSVILLLNRANRSWIIEKIADQLAVHLTAIGVDAHVSEEIDGTADIVHHMSWAFANLKTPMPSTMFITHLDDYHKMRMVKDTLASEVRVGVCMSRDTKQQLMKYGVPEHALCAIAPAHDNHLRPRKIVIGITSRVYPDGRKREAMLVALSRRMRLDSFAFRIFGSGWDAVIPDLEQAGAKVAYHPGSDDFRADYHLIMSEIPKFDYYLYLGIDEGSLGTLDALQCGIPTIITPQGFHLDLPGGITHPVLTEDDLHRVFKRIDDDRCVRINSVAGLTWKRYAEKHQRLWQGMIGKGDAEPGATGEVTASPELTELRDEQLRSNSLKLRRIISALSHVGIMRRLRSFTASLRRSARD